MLFNIISSEIKKTIKYPEKKKIEYVNTDELLLNLDKNKQNILIIDDYPPFVEMLRSFIEIKADEHKHNIIIATSQNAGFIAKEIISKIQINYAYIDLTLGGISFDENNEVVEIDGIDLFEMILEKNPNCKIKLISGHNIENDTPLINFFKEKFKKIARKFNIDENIESYFVNKLSELDKIFENIED